MDNQGLLVLPRLRVQNANAISGPLTWGFPSPTAFVGFVHALGRRLAAQYDITLDGVGIICHRFDPQVFQPPGKRTQVFCLTRNPVDKNEKPPSFVEEGRAHMEVSLLIQTHGYLDEAEGGQFAWDALDQAQAMRLAGGSVLPRVYGEKESQNLRISPDWNSLPDDQESLGAHFAGLRYRLLPGFALVSRQDVLERRLADMQAQQPDPTATALDALLDLSRLNMEPTPDPDDADKAEWRARRKPGWLAPIPVGYQAISPLYEPGQVANARDSATPFCFVESLYSLGEWISPHRIDQLSHLLWRYDAQPELGLYCCTNDYIPPTNVVA